MKRQTVKPAKGQSVLNPATRKPIDPKKGDKVVWSTFWERRRAEGAIELGPGPIADRIKEHEKALAAKKKADEEAAKKKNKPANGQEGN